MEETISLQEIFAVLKKRIGLIFVSMFFGIGVAGLITFFILTPKYSSQAQLIVRLPQSEATNVNDINANLQMITTYKDLIISDTVMNEVQQRMQTEYGTNVSVSELRGSIQVSQSQNSQMFSIIAKGTDSTIVANIANQTAQVFQENAKDMLSVDKITIISNATASMNPVSPNEKLNLLIGLALGIIIGIGLAFIMELFDKTVKDDRFVAEELGLPILGVVPKMNAKELEATISAIPIAAPIKKETYKSSSEQEQTTTIEKTNLENADSAKNVPKRTTRRSRGRL